MDKEEQSIRTFAIEYSKQPYSKCTRCLKPIPKKSLRAAIVIRKNKKQKKSQAEHQWCHFNCWKVPEELTKRPIEIFRGYPDLKDKDKKRVEKLIKAGTGATWKELQRQLLKKAEEEQATEAEPQESSGHTYFNDDDDDDELEKTKNSNGKKKKENAETEDIDMTAKLTGIQSTTNLQSSTSPNKKQKNSKKNNNEQKNINKKNSNNNKINKKKQPKVQQEHQQKTFVKLSNSKDQLQLEAITKEIQSTLNK
ncbi:unnamed protein product [Cunninghamella blakesleeana]